MEPKADELEEVESSYKIIAYRGQDIPKEFIPLVKAPFLNTLRGGNDMFKLIDRDAYFDVYGKFITFILNKPKTIIRLAALSDMTILGWSLMESDVLHYVWVKKEVRRQGIAKALVTEFSTFTHLTKYGISIWSNNQKWRFNPFV